MGVKQMYTASLWQGKKWNWVRKCSKVHKRYKRLYKAMLKFKL